MNKTLVGAALLVLIVLGVGIYTFTSTHNEAPQTDNNPSHIHDGTYIIEGQSISLVNGVSEIESAPGSAVKIITKYFGNDVVGDFDRDGRNDLGFLITHTTGGSGTFYYLVALLNKADGKRGTQGVFLGDRIAPQTTELQGTDTLVVNFATRKAGEAITVAPSIGASLYLKLDPETLAFGEVVQNFEGEANPNIMTLDMKTWDWVRTTYNDDKIITPLQAKKFSITFRKDNTFSATTDCNTVAGQYLVTGNKISFDKMISTRMYCENSQEGEFSKMLTESQAFMFTSQGELVITMKLDSGSIFLR